MVILARETCLLPRTSKAADAFGYLISPAVLLCTYISVLALEMSCSLLPRQDLAGRMLKSLGVWVIVSFFFFEA